MLVSLPQLQSLAQRLPDRLTEADKVELDAIYQQCLETLDDSEAMFGYVLAKAMRKHAHAGRAVQRAYLCSTI